MAGFALPHGLSVGDHALVTEPGPARGLATIEGFEQRGSETFVRLRIASRGLFLNEELARRLTPPLSKADATEMLARLSRSDATPDERGPDDQHITSIKTVSKGSWSAIEARLAQLYASRWKMSFGDQRMLDSFEQTLFPMIAHALGRDPMELRDEVRAGKPVFAATEARPPVPIAHAEDAKPLDGWESLFVIDLDGEIWIGERPDWHDDTDSGLAHIRVLAGRWHSYRLAVDEDDDPDGPSELLLVHESALAKAKGARWKIAARITSVIGSGNVNVVDRTALASEDTMDRVRYLGGVNAYGGHALCVATDGWSGPLDVEVSPPDGPTTMIKVPLCDDEE